MKPHEIHGLLVLLALAAAHPQRSLGQDAGPKTEPEIAWQEPHEGKAQRGANSSAIGPRSNAEHSL